MTIRIHALCLNSRRLFGSLRQPIDGGDTADLSSDATERRQVQRMVPPTSGERAFECRYFL